MTQKEITRLRVIYQTIDKVITIREAAELLSLSERQVLRLKKGVKEEGDKFIIHKIEAVNRSMLHRMKLKIQLLILKKQSIRRLILNIFRNY